jgi:hypothetical protein
MEAGSYGKSSIGLGVDGTGRAYPSSFCSCLGKSKNFVNHPIPYFFLALILTLGDPSQRMLARIQL